jgi:hypothetical protein
MFSSRRPLKQLLRLLGVFVILAAFAAPVMAEGCDEYCQIWCDGFCTAKGKQCHFQGCSGGPGSYQCYFGCENIQD